MNHTPEDVARMKEMWEVDGLTASQIAARFGKHMSRNVPIGLAHRRGWKKQGRAAPRQHTVHRKPEPEKPQPLKPEPQTTSVSRSKSVFDKGNVMHKIEIEKKSMPQPVDLPPPILERPGAPVSLADLGPSQCRWPVSQDDEGRHLFCAAPIPSQASCQILKRPVYCAHHALKAGAGFRHRAS